MNCKRLYRTLVAMVLASFVPAGFANFDPVNDDTDIFLANPTFAVTRPNVLFIVDNTANWNQPFAAEKTGLVNAINSLGTEFNVGLMMFTETGSGNSGVDGGYVRFAIRHMNATNKTVFTNFVNGLDVTNDKSNGGKVGLAMYEAYQYFGGLTAYGGSNKVKRDYAGNTNNTAGSLAGNAFADSSSTTYVSPITDGCQKNFIIYISNGPAQDNTNDLAVSEAKLKALQNNVQPIPISLTPNGSQGNWADEWARYMANNDCNALFDGKQTVITYTMDIGPSETVDGGQGPGWTALLKSMADNGKGKYFAISNSGVNTASEIESALKTIFSEVQAVNSVFASTTLPVSVNVRGTNLNQVYIGVFRPEPDKQPRWLGNLKMYKLEAVSATRSVFLADATGARAENSSTGFISNTATSFWTAESCFWSYLGADPEGTTTVPASCTVPTTYKYWSDSPDGDTVEKGGAAQRLRLQYPGADADDVTAQTGRKLYTCTAVSSGLCAAGASLSATPFSAAALTTHISAADVGAYRTYGVSTITTSGTTATAQLSGLLATWPSPFFAVGETIRIEGASPTTFSGDFTITAVDGILGTFSYTLPTALIGTTAVVTTSTAHQLNTGDLVQITGASPSDYNVTDVAITRLTDTTFSYQMASSPSTAVANIGSIVIKGKKTVSSITGVGTSATATITSHGYGSVTIPNFTITGSAITAFNNVSSSQGTRNGTNAVDYTTTTTIGGASANAGRITFTGISGHEAQVGDRLVISGAVAAGYNCASTSPCTVTGIPSATTLDYTFTGTPAPTVTTTTKPTSVQITRSFSTGVQTMRNGTTNGTRGNITATFPATTPHGISTNWTVTLTGSSATGGSYNVTAGTISSVPDGVSLTYSVGNSTAPDANQTTTGSNAGTMSFSRTISSTNITKIDPVISDTTTGMKAVTTITATSVASQTNATGIITAGRPTGADLSDTLRDQIINWVRGADNMEDENSFKYPTSTLSTATDVRGTIHGDVLHSRPAVVNYNRFSSDNDVYVFYGSNAGMIHALKGGVASEESGVSPGDERWAFVPREFFSKFKRLRDNSPTISSTNPRSYLADGPISVYTLDADSDGSLTSGASGDKVWLFFGARRGGRFIYALDITNPADPKFKWRKTNTDTGWGELGQTWSEPKVAKLRVDTGSGAQDKIVLIFGAGYDTNVDDVNPCLLQSVGANSVTLKAIGTGTVEYTAAGSCVINNPTGSTTTRTRTMGRGIFIVDADTGAVLWQAGPAPTGATHNVTVANMTCSIPSDITVIDIDRQGHADRGYVGDTCGNVWRIDFSATNPASWTVAQIAATSSTTATDIPNQRKFLFPPDVVFSTDTVAGVAGNYAAILIGSGDREHPFDTNVINRFYMIKDRNAADGTFTSIGTCTTSGTAGQPITDALLFDATDVVGNNECGFKLTLLAGEKNVGSAVTLASTTFFNTNQPSATAGGGACDANLGVARQYQINFEDAGSTRVADTAGTTTNRFVEHEGGGFLPSPVPAVVEIGDQKYEVVISGTSVEQPKGTTLDTRQRTYWYKEFE